MVTALPCSHTISCAMEKLCVFRGMRCGVWGVTRPDENLQCNFAMALCTRTTCVKCYSFTRSTELAVTASRLLWNSGIVFLLCEQKKISFSFIILFLSFLCSFSFSVFFRLCLLSVNARWCSLCRPPLSIIFVVSLFARCIATNHRRHRFSSPPALPAQLSILRLLFLCLKFCWKFIRRRYHVDRKPYSSFSFRYPNLFPHRPARSVFGMRYDAKNTQNVSRYWRVYMIIQFSVNQQTNDDDGDGDDDVE